VAARTRAVDCKQPEPAQLSHGVMLIGASNRDDREPTHLRASPAAQMQPILKGFVFIRAFLPMSRSRRSSGRGRGRAVVDHRENPLEATPVVP
jgi:hypothetical protein